MTRDEVSDNAATHMMDDTQDDRMDTTSDYGDELAWHDQGIATQLDLIESSIAAAPLEATQPTTSSRRPRAIDTIEIEVGIDADQVQVEPQVHTVVDEAYEQALVEALDELDRGNEPSDARSLWERYRKRRGWGALSVTDLVGPSWCEYQHTYRLASKAYLPPLERPTEILSKSGATITIDRTRTVAREKILDGGKAVHLKIEKQVMGDIEPVKVDVAGKEEWWALRFLNTMVCLETLVRTGRTVSKMKVTKSRDQKLMFEIESQREIPVTGFVGDFLVFGVIDEVERREIKSKPAIEPKTPSKPHKPTTPRTKKIGAKVELDISQRNLEAFFKSPSSSKMVQDPSDVDSAEPSTSPAEVPANNEVPSSSWGYIMSDTKTRKTPTLPYEIESRASRLQLMLYHRLLTSLLLPPAPELLGTNASTLGAKPFDWPRLYAHLSLDPTAEFGTSFLESIEPILKSLSIPTFQPKTLGEVVVGLQSFGSMMSRASPGREMGGGCGFLEEGLEIHYVMREKGRRGGRKRGEKVERERRRREEGLGRAMRESWRELDRGGTAREVIEVEKETEMDRVEALQLARAVEISLSEWTTERSASASRLDGETEESQVEPTKHELPILPDVGLLSNSLGLPKVKEGALSDVMAMEVDQDASIETNPPMTTTAPLVEVEVGPRYNFRRRRNPSGTIVSEVVEKGMTASSPPSQALNHQSEDKERIEPLTKLSDRTPSIDRGEEEGEADVHLDEGTPIGTHHFLNEPSELDAWLGHVMGYWNGTREAQGVEIGQTNRCRNCEFEDDCEWLKMKSEVSQQDLLLQLRKEARLTPIAALDFIFQEAIVASREKRRKLELGMLN
ncbi:BQ2448_7830 [Microbotryum intermedium]|uniref:BQ2448_7830 protein n=1 Tax=Microbotryum intermedium TaxID=269621 RepID=A0A238FRG2_9BASI|nr:BQ2448_7830 [Microbotryum intermedium]